LTRVIEPETDRWAISALAAAPAAVIRMDYSAIAAFCADQRERGITDVATFLAEPGRLGELLSTIRVTAVNDFIVREADAAGPEELVGPLGPEFHPYLSPDSLVAQIDAVFRGQRSIQTESTARNWAGHEACRTLNWAAGTTDGLPDYSDVLAIVTTTARPPADTVDHFAHREQLEALIEIGAQLTTILEPSVIFDKVLRTIDDVVHPANAALLLIDQQEQAIVGRAGAYGTELEFDLVMSGLAARAMAAGVALISDDISQETGFGEPARSQALARPGWSQIAAPIVSSGVPIGVIVLEFGPNDHGPTPEAASLIATLAQQAAVAIRNADVYGELAAGHTALQEAHDELKQTQSRLLSAQKMEAIGSLAAGIAHEINTPIQYVSDNISFLSDAARALLAVIEEAGPLVRALEERGDGGLATSYLSALDGADLDFIAEEIPDAFEQTQEGIERVAEIVRAMKEFAHPGSDEKASIDINRCIETTVQVAKNEWRYVADVNLDLDQGLPRVPALTGPFNQTLLILIVNAAQALGEMEHRGPTGKGTITISTRTEGDNAVVRVADNGPGIPPSVVEQIFDPFFTTKDVGKGSGQGLSIAHSVIFERHNGTIYVESEPGEGATFVIELPLLADYADAGRTKA